MTQKYEFVSEEELMEYFEDEEIKIISKRPTSNGILVEVEIEVEIEASNKDLDSKRWALVCYPNGNIYNPMYWGKKGPTYIESEKEVFNSKQIDDKLKYMKSSYDWKKQPV